tara:strand:- start:934 stop:1449 length:516 start_codon:yes stop_codon:yes gene_type:complete
LAIPLSQLKKVGGLVNPSTIIAKSALSNVANISQQKFGYDFSGLFIRLGIFYLIAFVFAKIMEATIFFRGGFVVFANLFGINIPKSDQLPEPLKKLFDGGYQGFKFWDIIKVIGIILVTYEYFQFRKETNGQVNSITTGVFVLIILILGITTIPELYKRIKETDFSVDKLR